jgi:hypothetical protein
MEFTQKSLKEIVSSHGPVKNETNFKTFGAN